MNFIKNDICINNSFNNVNNRIIIVAAVVVVVIVNSMVNSNGVTFIRAYRALDEKSKCRVTCILL